MAITRGRDVDPRDAHAVLISESAAKAFWPNEDPIGRQVEFRFTPGVRWDIVGVVRDIKFVGLDEATPMPAAFQWSSERPWTALSFVARTAGPPEAAGPSLAAVVRDLDPEQPVGLIQTMDERIAATTASRRLEMDILAVFAALAATLAGVGLFSVLAHAVRGRAREIAVRTALGAPASAVIRLVVVEGLVPTAGGVLAGLAGGVLLGPVLRTLVFGIGAFDPMTYAFAAAALTVIAGLAGIAPALRAARLDPLKMLREE
jgi:ABC-type antimicrobial peptide transport system permease subunit